jgi:two-component system, OmpR family, KDP operon response regulator KdpE
MKKVLIVEDHDLIRELYDMSLGSEYSLIFYSNGEDAIKDISNICPDLIIMDIGLPGIDGISTIKIIRGRIGPKVPIIIISGNLEIDHATAGLRLGVSELISKPCSTQEILDVVKRKLGDQK